MLGCVFIVHGCAGPSGVVGGAGSTGEVLDPIEGTGGRWEPEDTDDVGEPEPMGDEPQCHAQWLDNPAPAVLADGQFECDGYGFATHGLAVVARDGAAIVTVADDFREWIVRASPAALALVSGSPEGFGRQRLWTTIDAQGRFILAGTQRGTEELSWEVWALGTQWRRLAQVPVPLGTIVTGLDASPAGDIAAWLEVDHVQTIARADDDWDLRDALDLPGANRHDAPLTRDGAEVVVDNDSPSDSATHRVLARVEGADTMQLGDPATSDIDLVFAAPTRGRAFSDDAGSSGTRSSWTETATSAPSRGLGDSIERWQSPGPTTARSSSPTCTQTSIATSTTTTGAPTPTATSAAAVPCSGTRARRSSYA